MKFIHITDTHFVPPGQGLYGLDPRARLDTAVAAILRDHADAACVVVTGDLAHLGEEAAYHALRDALVPLSMPVHLLIGNHDDRATLCRVFPNVPTDADGFIQYVVETPEGPFVMVDTNSPGESLGRLCERRLGWLAETLDGLQGDRPATLFLHHPPFPVHIPSMDRIMLQDGEALAAVLEPRRDRLRHIFFGHLHRPICGAWRGIPWSTVPGVNHQVPLDLVSQPVPGSHERPAFGVVIVEDDHLVIHQHDFIDDGPRFLLADGMAARAATVAELT